MFSRFFIDRPIFASVLSILIVLVGAVCIGALPVAQFPEVVPPSISVTASYPGADARMVSDTVAAPIEQELSGAKNLLYYQSTCSNDGNLTTTVYFETGSDLDMAQVEVQNRVGQATPRLPQEVTRQGVRVVKKSSNMLMVVAILSDDPAHDVQYLSNFATINILDAVKRVPGVGDAMVYGGADYAMRIWLDPDRMAQRSVTVSDVTQAVQEQNGLYAAGRIGQRPGPAGVQLTVPVTTRGRFDTPEQFAGIILRSEADGSTLRISDIGRVELGSQGYDLFGRLDGKPTTFLPVYLQTGANALATVQAVRATLDELSAGFPAGVRCTVPYDTTPFVTVSIHHVVQTLFEAVILVLVVVFLFLQSWRATLIPLLAVPVSVVGTFAGLMLLGFSINTLTLFALVLAIGIVVDDAIVVVENVERIMHATGKNVREATVQAMEEVSGPVVAIVLVLCAVFVPVAFLGGLTGIFYQQFALTIALSVVISGIVALTLSPALCRLLLRPADHHAGPARNPLLRFFRAFNAGFDRLIAGYGAGVGFLLRRMLVGLAVMAALCAATWGLFRQVPSGFIPEEDQGSFLIAVQLPDGASLERTEAKAREVEDFLLRQPAIEHVLVLGGMNMLANGSNATNAATLYAVLRPWEERTTEATSLRAAIMACWQRFGGDPQARVLAFNMPPVPGLGTRTGIEFQLQDRGGAGYQALVEATEGLVAGLARRPELSAPSVQVSMHQPQLLVDVDRTQIKSMGLSMDDVFGTLQTNLGSLYVNDFTRFGRVWKVQLQAEPGYRSSPDALRRQYVRNQAGDLLPLASVLTTTWQAGPNLVTRFNGYPAITVTAGNAAGWSTGQAMAAAEAEAAKLPGGFQVAWSGASLQERRAGSQAGMIMLFGLVVVFLVLAAQYESWALPTAVMLAVPLGIFGALAACWLTGLPNDIYVQIGLLVLIGLAAKNAILIVEFAAERMRAGSGVADAALEAARLRFRPIIMTSLAFTLGVVPLILSSGAGAAGRISMGIGVFGGMVAATVFAVFLVPVFFRLVVRDPPRKG